MMKTALLGFRLFGVAAALSLTVPAQAMVRGKPVHAIALHGEPKYGPNESFPYNNANAPKGGTLRLMSGGQTFDSLNSFSLKGVPAIGLSYLGGNSFVSQGLMVGGDDEASTYYCLLCETVEVAEDNSWTEFALRPEARFTDGTPVTAEDVVFSFNTLMTKGMPTYKLYWGDVEKVEKTGERKVRFTFKNKTNAELPLILGQLPVLNEKFWEAHDIAETTLDKPVGSGPYIIDSFEPGRFISYKRDPNYWGKDVGVVKGTFNFDEIRFEYFRDLDVAFEAFKSGAFDYFPENTARRWATGYDFPAVKDGRVKKLEVPSGLPMMAQAFTYNLRHDKFKDIRVRQALNLAFDFESLNKTIFYDAYTRLHSYWQLSPLEAKGLPTPEELALLEPWRGKVPDEVFTQAPTQPTTDGNGNPRDNLLKARGLLEQAGWEIVDGVLINKQTKQPFSFEVLEVSANLERVLTPWLQNLEKLGIKGTLRVIDTSQIVNRMNEFDYDVTVLPVQNSTSPGNEQAEYWGSAAADRPGSRNYSGVKDPAVDALIDVVIKATDLPSQETATHALDRVLFWNQYRTLHYGPVTDRHVYWTKLAHPERYAAQGMPSGSGTPALNWWMGSAAAATASAPAADGGGSNTGLIIGAIVVLAIGGLLFARRKRAA